MEYDCYSFATRFSSDSLSRSKSTQALSASTSSLTSRSELPPCKQIRTRSSPRGTVGCEMGLTRNPLLLRYCESGRGNLVRRGMMGVVRGRVESAGDEQGREGARDSGEVVLVTNEERRERNSAERVWTCAAG